MQCRPEIGDICTCRRHVELRLLVYEQCCKLNTINISDVSMYRTPFKPPRNLLQPRYILNINGCTAYPRRLSIRTLHNYFIFDFAAACLPSKLSHTEVEPRRDSFAASILCRPLRPTAEYIIDHSSSTAGAFSRR